MVQVAEYPNKVNTMEYSAIYRSYTAICIVLALAIYLAKKFASLLSGYHATTATMKGIHGPKKHLLAGNLSILDPHEDKIKAMMERGKTFPKMMPLWYGPFLCYLHLHFPDLVKVILSTKEPKDRFVYSFMKPWLGDGILISSGKKWMRNRRLLTPIFHFNVLKEYVKIFNDTSEVLLDKWKIAAEIQDTIEISRDLSLMTLDAMLQCTMSTKSNCQSGENKNSYVESVYLLGEIIMQRLANPFYHNDFIFSLSPMGIKFRKHCDIAHKYTDDVIRKRKELLKNAELTLDDLIELRKKVTGRNLDFLDILLLTKDEKGIGLTDQEIRAEVDTFMFEGHDTTASGLSWAIYNLAKHPEIQEKCRKEAQDVLGSRSRVEWEDLSKLQYLTMCIKESLRIYPPVISVQRTISKPLYFERGFGKDQFNVDSKIPNEKCDKTLPPDTNVAVGIMELHHNPYVWSNPRIFDPERFTLDNAEKRSPHAFIPFSSGPRNCIGQNFAMNEMKSMLALALCSYRFVVDDSCPKPLREIRLILHSKNGICVKIEKLI